ncbi:GntR family transcriptional regulator [Capsulimonas corticalis]|uniref:GntR family transcriptional regulator n=1 Tax=Capsulimonas corticalis TaxID=2219043 RepID=UPI00140372A8|nr:substrate-binding domain-containing protein [Capsulimonas corticalis]
MKRIPGAPLHAQINQQIVRMIEQQFRDGEAFYSEQELTQAFGVSRVTIRRALQDLDRMGYLVRKAGYGATVRKSGAHLTQEQADAVPQRAAPDAGGRRLRSIGLIGSGWQSEYIAAMVDKLTRACLERGVELKLRLMDRERPEAVLDQITEGPEEEALLLFVGDRLAVTLHRTLRERGYRTISLDTASAHYEGRVVATDSRAAVRLGLEHLFALGHERITLMVNEYFREEDVQRKIEEFLETMDTHGLSGRIACSVQRGYEGGYAMMPDIWRGADEERPTAIMTVSDAGAWAALRWLREHGVAVPEQVSVVGFEDASSSRYVTPPLTTIAHPIDALTARAVEMLLAPSWAETHPVHEMIPPALVVRESTGPARQ